MLPTPAMKSSIRRFIGSSLTFLFAALCVAQAPAPKGDGSVAVAVVVTVLTKKSKAPAEVQKEDIIVREGGVRKPIEAWIPAREDHASLQLAIVIDEASRKDLGGQYESLKKFITAQPPNSSIGIYYALGNSLRAGIQLTTDHGAVTKALRPPLGDFGNLVGPYSAVSQLIDGWPLTLARREILFLTPGFDMIHRERYSSDMRAVIEEAQRSGIVVHPIMVNSPYPRLTAYSEIARSNLTELADETGGASLVGSLTAPLSVTEETGGSPIRDTIPILDLGPVLKSLGTVLENQYFLVWRTTPSKNKNGELRSFSLQAEDRNLRLTAPAKVFVP